MSAHPLSVPEWGLTCETAVDLEVHPPAVRPWLRACVLVSYAAEEAALNEAWDALAPRRPKFMAAVAIWRAREGEALADLARAGATLTRADVAHLLRIPDEGIRRRAAALLADAPRAL